MHKPPHGREYRDPVTKELVPHTGFKADPNNLDHVRAIACGDLVPVTHHKKAAPAEPKE